MWHGDCSELEDLAPTPLVAAPWSLEQKEPTSPADALMHELLWHLESSHSLHFLQGHPYRAYSSPETIPD